MVQNLPNDHRVFHAGNDAHRALALLAGLNIDMAYRDVGQGRHQRPVFAVMSMDGRYAENAGAIFCGEQIAHGSG